MIQTDANLDVPARTRKVPAPARLPNALVVARGTPLIPGKMYLRLYHGRTDPDQKMDDWGSDGPTFGPLISCVQTYCTGFRIFGESGDDEIWIRTRGDMVLWDACYYGDMELFVADTKHKA
jgi:hypothetical protein